MIAAGIMPSLKMRTLKSTIFATGAVASSSSSCCPILRLMPIILPVFATICGGLGIWQVYRLQWKNNLLATLSENQRQKSEHISAWEWPHKLTAYTKVKLKGKFLTNNSIKPFVLVGPQFFDSKLGYRIIVPFQCDERIPEKNDFLMEKAHEDKSNRTIAALLDIGWISEKADPNAVLYEFFKTHAADGENIVATVLLDEIRLSCGRHERQQTYKFTHEKIIAFARRNTKVLYGALGIEPTNFRLVPHVFECVPNGKEFFARPMLF